LPHQKADKLAKAKEAWAGMVESKERMLLDDEVKKD